MHAAAAAFANWRKTPISVRAKVLNKAADYLEANVERFATDLTREQGKSLSLAKDEFLRSAQTLRFYAVEGQSFSGETFPQDDAGQVVYTEREPLGVVTVITPWNFPVSIPARKIAPALIAGNVVVFKPSTDAPLSGYRLTEAFVAAGIPKGVLNLVNGRAGDVGAAITQPPVVRAISFTGSTAVGKHLLALAAEGVKRTTLELGGHAPYIVFDDVDVENIAEQAVASKFRNAGQICTAPTRFLVQDTVYRQFVASFTAAARRIRVGAGDDRDTTMGPVANVRRIRAMERLVTDAKQKGAQISCGGHRIGAQGFFWAPTVLSDVPPDALCLREEPFGPLAAIVPFNTEDEAIALANGLPYGLASYAFTQDANRAIRLADAIEAGMVGINTLAITLPETPFGGVKESGYGLEGGVEGVESYLHTKFVSQGIALPRPP